MNMAMNLPVSQKWRKFGVWYPVVFSNAKPKVLFHSVDTTFINKYLSLYDTSYMLWLLYFRIV
jgi:hypothetical protein